MKSTAGLNAVAQGFRASAKGEADEAQGMGWGWRAAAQSACVTRFHPPRPGISPGAHDHSVSPLPRDPLCPLKADIPELLSPNPVNILWC